MLFFIQLILGKSVQKLNGPSISEYIFSSAVLQWLYYPTTLACSSTDIAKEVLDSIFIRPSTIPPTNYTLKLNLSKVFNFVKATHSRIYKAAEIITSHSKLVSDKEIFQTWIKQLNESSNVEMKCQTVFYLFALLSQKNVSKDNYINKLEILKALREVVEFKKEVAAGMLPIILHSFKNLKDPEEILEFLREIIHLSITKV